MLCILCEKHGGGGRRQHADYKAKRIKSRYKDAHNFCHKEVVSAVHGGCSYILIITKIGTKVALLAHIIKDYAHNYSLG